MAGWCLIEEKLLQILEKILGFGGNGFYFVNSSWKGEKEEIWEGTSLITEIREKISKSLM